MTTPSIDQSVVVQTPEQLVEEISRVVGRALDSKRKIIGIAGPPASGKSTLLSTLVSGLQTEFSAEQVIGVPMDGFHLDNDLLDNAGTRDRKGAPHTFDVGGLRSLMCRLGTGEAPVYAPMFDRASDLSRNCAVRIDNKHHIVLIEGNYLMLNLPGWRTLADSFDLTISIDVDNTILQQRLLQRWLDHGLSAEAALARANSNDIPNAETVREHSKTADIIYRPENF